jgi:hypothetical protein
METLALSIEETLAFPTPPSDPRDKLIWQLLQFAAKLHKSGEIYDISPDLAIARDRQTSSEGPWPRLYLFLTPEEYDVPVRVEVEFSEEEANFSKMRGELWFTVSVTRRGDRNELLFPASELPAAFESLKGLIKVAIFQDKVLR